MTSMEFSAGTVGHTSMHHLVAGPWQGPNDQSGLPKSEKLNIPLCDPDDRCGRVIRRPDPRKLCGGCKAKHDEMTPEWTAPDVEMVHIGELRLAAYQRKPNDRRARRMAAEYDPRLMHPIDVSFRDGVYWNCDGGHRALMGRYLGWEKIAAIVRTGLAYEEEAELFAKADDPRTVKGLDAMQRWNALHEARDNAHMDVAAALAGHGYKVGTGLRCPDQLLTIYRRHGMPVLAETAGICRAVPPKGAEHLWDSRQIPAWFFWGIAQVITMRPQIDHAELAKVLGKRVREIELFRHAHIRKHWDAKLTASLMVEAYNMGRRTRRVDPIT